MRPWRELRALDASIRAAESAAIAAGDVEAYLRIRGEVGAFDAPEASAWDLAVWLLGGRARRPELSAPAALLALRAHPLAIVVAASAISDHPSNRRGPWVWAILAEPFGPRSGWDLWRAAARESVRSELLLGGLRGDGAASVVRAGPRLLGALEEERERWQRL